MKEHCISIKTKILYKYVEKSNANKPYKIVEKLFFFDEI